MSNPLANWRCVCGRTASIEHQVNGHCPSKDIIESIRAERDRLRAALEKIKDISVFGRPGGPIVMSEHYEGAWLDCVEIAKEALKEKS